METWDDEKPRETPAFVVGIYVLGFAALLILGCTWVFKDCDRDMRKQWVEQRLEKKKTWLLDCSGLRPLADCQKDYDAVQRLRK